MSALSDMFSPAADRNKGPILEIIKELIQEEDRSLLEIGSGTGQHALEFSKAFPFLTITTTDTPENAKRLAAIQGL